MNIRKHVAKLATIGAAGALAIGLFASAAPAAHAAAVKPLDVQAGSSYLFTNLQDNRNLHAHAHNDQLTDDPSVQYWDPSSFQNIGGHTYALMVLHGASPALCADLNPTTFKVYAESCDSSNHDELWAVITPSGDGASANWLLSEPYTWETAFMTDQGPSNYYIGVNSAGAGNWAVWDATCEINC